MTDPAPKHDASDSDLFPPWSLWDTLIVVFLFVALTAGGAWVTWVCWNVVLERQQRAPEHGEQLSLPVEGSP